KQRADVDAGLHCRRHREHVDRRWKRRLLLTAEKDALEARLAARGVSTLGLPGQLLGVQSRDWLLCAGHLGVVVAQVAGMPVGLTGEVGAAVHADTRVAVSV